MRRLTGSVPMQPIVAIVLAVLGAMTLGGVSIAAGVGFESRSGQASDSQRQERSGTDPRNKKRTPVDKKKNPPGEKPGTEKKGEKPADKSKKLEIDPELKRQIDKLFEAEAEQEQVPEKKAPVRKTPSKASGGSTVPGKAQPAGGKRAGQARKQPPKSSGRRPSTSRLPPKPAGGSAANPRPNGNAPSGPTTSVNIAPVQNDVPAEERTYVFTIKDGTYEQLIEGFARQTGFGVMGETPKNGKVTFVSTEELTFLQALSRVRMLLFNYKPHEPYWIQRKEDHLLVSRFNDMIRQLGLERMFTSIEEFYAAGLADDDVAFVLFTPKSGSLADLRVVRDFMPDYFRVTPINDTKVSLFGLVKDVHKYMELREKLNPQGDDDPRTIEVIKLEYIRPAEAVEKLNTLMNSRRGSSARSRPASTRGTRTKDASPLNIMVEPALTILPDEAHGALIVRAMRDRIEEIKRLLPLIDRDIELDGFDPVVIEVKNADPGELIEVVRQIMAALSNSGAALTTPASRSKSRAAKSGAVRAPMAPVRADGVTMLVHPGGQAIIVIGSDEDVQHARTLIERFDVSSGPDRPVRVELEFAEATAITTTLTMLLGGTSAGKTKLALGKSKIVPDPANKAVWISGSVRDVERARELISILDVEGELVSLHIVTLAHQMPSFVANMLRESEGSPALTVPAPKKGGSRRPTRSAAVSKFTAQDESGRLFILCTDTEWEEYSSLIQQLELAAKPEKPFVRFELAHVTPAYMMIQIDELLNSNPGSPDSWRLSAIDGAMLVSDASDAELDAIKELIAELDHPSRLEKRTFEIRYGDAAEIRTVIEALMNTDARSPAGRPKARPAPKGATASASVLSDDLVIVELEDRLIVHATPEKMVEVAALIAELDIEKDKPELHIYDGFAPGTDLSKVVETLISVQAGSSRGRSVNRKSANQSSPSGTRFIPQVATNQLIVVAPPEEFPRIERFLDVFREGGDRDPREVEYIDVVFANPVDLVVQLAPILDVKVEELISAGKLQRTQLATAPGASRIPRPNTAQIGETAEGYHMQADERNKRIVIVAVRVVIDEARKLVSQFDTAGDDKDEVFRTIELINAVPVDMVRAITEMRGGVAGRPVTRTSSRKGGKPSITSGSDEAGLVILEAPGGGAVVLRGPLKEVDQASEWIETLDAMTSPGRVIKSYEIHSADVIKLGDLIMNVVEAAPARGAKRSPVRPQRAVDTADEDTDMFATSKTWTGQELYIQADLLAHTMIVAASPAKLVQIDGIMADFDPEDGEGPLSDGITGVPSFMYELKYADPFDAEFELQGLLDQLWDPPDQVPQVTSALFGDYLIIKYPDESRFSEIEQLIRTHIDKPDPADIIPGEVPMAAPFGLTPMEVALWIKRNHPEVDVEIIDETSQGDITYGVQRLEPLKSSRKHPCVLPSAFHRIIADAILMADAPDEDQNAKTSDQPALKKKDTGQRVDDVMRESARALLASKDSPAQPPATGEPKPATSTEDDANPLTKLRIRVDNATQEMTIEGAAGLLKNVPEWLEDLEKEVKEANLPPDIRIYRVRYIDVYSAAAILEEMFNATRQQIAAAQAAQRRQQQQQRQQQQRGRRNQQTQPGQKPGQTQGQPGQQGGRGQQQPQPQIPQLPPTAVRIYPNPRDRSLIFRADSNQYPVILKLLATIDQPQPIDSEMRTFRPKKLNASDVVETLKEMLGLEQQRGRARTRSPALGGNAGRSGRRPTARREPGGYLPQTIMQKITGGASSLGVDAKDIKLTANEASNTILAMAPVAALDWIGDLINQLESEEIPERITRYYELINVDAQEAADYLTTEFSEGRIPGASGKGKRFKAGGTSKGGLQTPTFIAYPRLNQLTVMATEELFEKIEASILRLDVKSEEETWEHLTLKNADSQSVADTLTQMFGGTSGTGRAVNRARAPRSTGSGPKFIGEEGGRMLIFSAPQKIRDQITDTIAKLEANAQEKTSVRVVALEYATPSDVAEAVEAALGGGKSSGRRRSRGGATSTARFTITPHDGSKRLFVVADDETFGEIESLANTLDVPASMGVDFRIYPLQFANARQVHEMLTKLITDYLRRVGRTGGVEPFSVEVDDKSNSLVVLGGPTVFKFLEENLAKVDNPANAPSPPGFFMIALENANAQEVAQNINRLWSQKGLSSGQTPPMAEANRSMNILIVRGTQEQLEEIKKEFIEPLQENAPDPMLSETISLAWAQPEAVADSIKLIFEDRKRASQAGGRQNTGSPMEFTVAVTPDVNTGQLIVQANEENMAFIKTRVAELDREDVAANSATTMKIYPIKFADPNAVVNIITQWSRSRTTSGGRARNVAARDAVIAVAENETQSVVVTAGESNHLIIKEMIDGLDDETLATRQRKQHVLKLSFASSAEVADQFTQVFRHGARRQRGDQGPAFVADAKTNTIVATLNEEELGDVNRLLLEIDIEPSLEATRITEVYPLQYADPGSVNAVILNMFRWDRRSQPSPSEQVTSAVESATQSVIVTASSKNHVVIKAFIEKVDVESNFAKETHLYPLKHANAEDVAKSLQDVYRGRRSTRRGEQPVQITHDTATNMLIVSANRIEMDELTMLVESLDVPPEAERQRQIKSISLKFAEPWNVQEAINKLFKGSRNPRDQVTAVPEYGVRSVIVSASPENMLRVEELIASLDTQDGGLLEVHVVNLENADAEAVTRTLTEIFIRSAPKRQGQQVQPISIAALQGSKAVLVKCDEEDFVEIAEIIKELDSEDTLGAESVRVVTLLYGDATEIQRALETTLQKPGGRGRELIGNVKIAALAQSNALVVSGSTEGVDRVEAQIKLLDQTIDDSGPQVIRLKYANAGQVLPTLQEMFTQRGGGRRGQQPPVIQASEALNALIVRASRMDLVAIEEIVAQLDTEEVAAQPTFRIVQLGPGVNVEDLAALVEGSVNDGAKTQSAQGRGSQVASIQVTPDTRSRSLVISGPQTLQAEAEKLALAMQDMGPAGGQQMKIIDITKVPGDDVQRLIEKLRGDSSGSKRSNRGRGGGRRGGSSRRGRRP